MKVHSTYKTLQGKANTLPVSLLWPK